MKAKIKNNELKFRKIELKLTFESQEEIDMFYSVLNHSAIIDASELPRSCFAVARCELENYANLSMFKEFSDRLKERMRRHFQ